MVLSHLDFFAFLCFMGCWLGYTWFARRKAKTTDCIARNLHQHRIYWMYELMKKDLRVAEVSLLANLERSIGFFASTTLLVLAGVLTLFAKVEKLEQVISTIPYTDTPVAFMLQIKLGVLAFLFILSFFHFTWSMRQYGFLNVMVGAAPIDEEGRSENLIAYAQQMATVQDQAAHSYNYGLRLYYFSIAVICWFFHPVLFVVASLYVVYVLYVREFNSKAVRALSRGRMLLQAEREAQINVERNKSE